jgi:hypothetical protein
MQLVGMLASPPPDTALRGVVVTAAGAGGGPGPFDPRGEEGTGGGSFGPYSLYMRLAAELPRAGLAVLLVHYKRPWPVGVARGGDQMNALAAWFAAKAGRPGLAAVYIGWSRGGAVAIEAATKAKAKHARSARRIAKRAQKTQCVPLAPVAAVDIRGVATIASQTGQIQRTSPKQLRLAGCALLLLHGLADDCLSARCSKRISEWASAGSVRTPRAKKALAPLQVRLFEGEGHGVKSAHDTLTPWIAERFGVGLDVLLDCLIGQMHWEAMLE